MRTLLICIAITLAPLGGAATAQDPDPAPFVGNWMGALSVGGVELRMRLQVTAEDGTLNAVMYSVDQGNAAITVASTTVSGTNLSLSMPMIAGGYEGSLSEDGRQIDGTFTQAGNALPLVLERVSEEEAAGPARPQNPEEPFPYHVEEVSYPNPDGGHVLAGTFTRPEDGGPFPAVILISGSGPQDRDEALMGHRPFLVLSDHLTRSGIAVLRFDDRGVGESTGDFATATSRDFASDVLAGVAYLQTRDDVDQEAIGLAGHSEGGLIAPIAATQSDDISYIVLMAGPGITGEEILYAQGALIARAGGATEEQIAESETQQRAIYEILKTESDPTRAAEMIAEVARAAFEGLSEAERAQQGITDEESFDRVLQMQVQQVNSPWFRYFLTYDPAPTLETGHGAGAGDQRREGPPGPLRGEPARDRGGAAARRQHRLRDPRATRPQSPLPAFRNGRTVGVLDH